MSPDAASKGNHRGLSSTQFGHKLTNASNGCQASPPGPGYGVSTECMACSDRCDNDMLLMSGFLCHKCLPDNCRRGRGLHSFTFHVNLSRL
jgi:hypothetical protein